MNFATNFYPIKKINKEKKLKLINKRVVESVKHLKQEILQATIHCCDAMRCYATMVVEKRMKPEEFQPRPNFYTGFIFCLDYRYSYKALPLSIYTKFISLP